MKYFLLLQREQKSVTGSWGLALTSINHSYLCGIVEKISPPICWLRFDISIPVVFGLNFLASSICCLNPDFAICTVIPTLQQVDGLIVYGHILLYHCPYVV